MQQLFKTYEDIYEKYNILNLSQIPFCPSPSRAVLLTKIDRELDNADRTKTQDRLDEILVAEIVERFEVIKNELLLPQQKEFSYEKAVRGYGITAEDLRGVEKEFRKFDFEKFSEEWQDANGQCWQGTPESKDEMAKVEAGYTKLLEASFKLAPKTTSGRFSSFEDYFKSTINFSPDPSSEIHSVSENVNLNAYKQDILYVKRGYRYVPVLDIFESASTIGEEGLLGHQGGVLVTEKEAIPEFLKIRFNPAVEVNVESLGRIGSMIMVNELKKNPALIDRIDPTDFEFLKKRFELKDLYDTVYRFVTLYEGFCYFDNGRNMDAAAERMYDVVKSESFRSEEHKRRTTAFYSGDFWVNYDKELEHWAYHFAEQNAKKIVDMLGEVGDAASKNILGNLQIGNWTNKGFGLWRDYLKDEFS